MPRTRSPQNIVAQNTIRDIMRLEFLSNMAGLSHYERSIVVCLYRIHGDGITPIAGETT